MEGWRAGEGVYGLLDVEFCDDGCCWVADGGAVYGDWDEVVGVFFDVL